MITCEKCNAPAVRILHTRSGRSFKTQDARCDECGARYVMITEVREYTGRIGTGYKALARDLEKRHGPPPA